MKPDMRHTHLWMPHSAVGDDEDGLSLPQLLLLPRTMQEAMGAALAGSQGAEALLQQPPRLTCTRQDYPPGLAGTRSPLFRRPSTLAL
jgi:hypothetical protein